MAERERTEGEGWSFGRRVENGEVRRRGAAAAPGTPSPPEGEPDEERGASGGLRSGETFSRLGRGPYSGQTFDPQENLASVRASGPGGGHGYGPLGQAGTGRNPWGPRHERREAPEDRPRHAPRQWWESEPWWQPSTAGDVMVEVPTVHPDETLARAATLMREERIGVVPVVDQGGRLRGLLTDREIVERGINRREPLGQLRAAEVMARDIFVVIPETPLEELIDLMGEKRLRWAPVVDERDVLLGMVELARLTRERPYRAQAEEALEGITRRQGPPAHERIPAGDLRQRPRGAGGVRVRPGDGDEAGAAGRQGAEGPVHEEFPTREPYSTSSPLNPFERGISRLAGRLFGARPSWEREPLTAGDVMTTQMKVVTREDPVRHVVELMRRERVGAVPVVDIDDRGQRLAGIITDRDLVVRGVGAEQGRFEDFKVGDLMSEAVEAVLPDTPLSEVLEIMGRKQIRRVPVTADHGELLGLVSLGDVARRADYDEELQRALQRMAGRRSFWNRFWR